jgi:hypothetical protein
MCLSGLQFVLRVIYLMTLTVTKTVQRPKDTVMLNNVLGKVRNETVLADIATGLRLKLSRSA